MNNFNIPPQLMQMFKGGNPQQLAMNMLQKNAQGNPMVENVMGMMNNGNTSGVEQIARNLCKSRGINPDEMYKQVFEQFKSS